MYRQGRGAALEKTCVPSGGISGQSMRFGREGWSASLSPGLGLLRRHPRPSWVVSTCFLLLARESPTLPGSREASMPKACVPLGPWRHQGLDGSSSASSSLGNPSDPSVSSISLPGGVSRVVLFPGLGYAHRGGRTCGTEGGTGGSQGSSGPASWTLTPVCVCVCMRVRVYEMACFSESSRGGDLPYLISSGWLLCPASCLDGLHQSVSESTAALTTSGRSQWEPRQLPTWMASDVLG